MLFLTFSIIIITKYMSKKDHSDISHDLESENIIVREGSCPMADDYEYIETENYPLYVHRRIENKLELIRFPELPAEEEFISQAVIDKDEAVQIVQDGVIVFTDGGIPKANVYNYVILEENIESIEMSTERTAYCNKEYGQGTIDSNIRVVWHIIMKESHYNESFYKNKSYWYNWNIYVDAVTGEIVYVSSVDDNTKRYRYIPGWDFEFDLEQYGSEYIQLELP